MRGHNCFNCIFWESCSEKIEKIRDPLGCKNYLGDVMGDLSDELETEKQRLNDYCDNPEVNTLEKIAVTLGLLENRLIVGIRTPDERNTVLSELDKNEKRKYYENI